MSATSIAGRQRLWVVIIFTALFVLVVNLAFWGVYRQTERLLERELSRRLSTIALLASQKLVISDADLVNEASREWFTERLREVTAIDSVTELFLLDEQYHLLASTANETDSLYPFTLLYRSTIDSLFFVSNQTVTITPLRQVGSIWLRTAFAPVFDYVGVPVAVIGVDANIDYFEDLIKLRRRLIIASFISLGVGFALGAIFYLLQRRFQRTEEELGRSRTHAQLGQMVAVVSHEIKNPLMIMRGAAERLRRKSELPEASYLIEEVDRLDTIVSGYLSFAKSGGSLLAGQRPQSFDLHSLLNDVRRQINERYSGQTIVWEDWPEGVLLELTGYPSPLKQILQNLLVNSVEASLTAKKALRLAVRIVQERENDIEIAIQDFGPGITPADLKRVFEPFFTTKQTGSGLGLYLSRKIVDEMGGSLDITSTPGEGTTVQLTLPKQADSAGRH